MIYAYLFMNFINLSKHQKQHLQQANKNLANLLESAFDFAWVGIKSSKRRINLMIAISNEPNAIVPKCKKNALPKDLNNVKKGKLFFFVFFSFLKGVQYHIPKEPASVIWLRPVTNANNQNNINATYAWGIYGYWFRNSIALLICFSAIRTSPTCDIIYQGLILSKYEL